MRRCRGRSLQTAQGGGRGRVPLYRYLPGSLGQSADVNVYRYACYATQRLARKRRNGLFNHSRYRQALRCFLIAGPAGSVFDYLLSPKKMVSDRGGANAERSHHHHHRLFNLLGAYNDSEFKNSSEYNN